MSLPALPGLAGYSEVVTPSNTPSLRLEVSGSSMQPLPRIPLIGNPKASFCRSSRQVNVRESGSVVFPRAITQSERPTKVVAKSQIQPPVGEDPNPIAAKRIIDNFSPYNPSPSSLITEPLSSDSSAGGDLSVGHSPLTTGEILALDKSALELRIIEAVRNQNEEECRSLLSPGTLNIDEIWTSKGNTLLTDYAIHGNLECVMMLLRLGADMHAENQRGRNSFLNGRNATLAVEIKLSKVMADSPERPPLDFLTAEPLAYPKEQIRNLLAVHNYLSGYSAIRCCYSNSQSSFK